MFCWLCKIRHHLKAMLKLLLTSLHCTRGLVLSLILILPNSKAATFFLYYVDDYATGYKKTFTGISIYVLIISMLKNLERSTFFFWCQFLPHRNESKTQVFCAEELVHGMIFFFQSPHRHKVFCLKRLTLFFFVVPVKQFLCYAVPIKTMYKL